jgi:hypothetical protein
MAMGASEREAVHRGGKLNCGYRVVLGIPIACATRVSIREVQKDLF